MLAIVRPPHAKAPVALLGAGFLLVQYSGAAAEVVIEPDTRSGTGLSSGARSGTGLATNARSGTGLASGNRSGTARPPN